MGQKSNLETLAALLGETEQFHKAKQVLHYSVTQCPHCSSGDVKVYSSRKQNGHVFRFRSCGGCGRRWKTVEIMICDRIEGKKLQGAFTKVRGRFAESSAPNPPCPRCESVYTHKNKRTKDGRYRYKCSECLRHWTPAN